MNCNTRGREIMPITGEMSQPHRKHQEKQCSGLVGVGSVVWKETFISNTIPCIITSSIIISWLNPMALKCCHLSEWMIQAYYLLFVKGRLYKLEEMESEWRHIILSFLQFNICIFTFLYYKIIWENMNNCIYRKTIFALIFNM